MYNRLLLLLLLCSVTIANVRANGVSVSSVLLAGQNIASDYTLINFDITWDNSWRTNAGPNNWDACWVFAKYRKKTSNIWNHATLNYTDGSGTGDGHTVPSGATISSSNDNGSGGAHGVFIYANAIKLQSTATYSGVQLRWNYGIDLLADGDSVEICVFAVEMVYVPSGSFYVGDGNLTINGNLRQQAANNPFLITSEAAITMGGGGVSDLHNNNASGMNTQDDFNNAVSRTLPAGYPKGYNAFYVMKYETSQEQYVEYLNKLTRAQQANRFPSTVVGTFMNNGGAPGRRNGVRLMSDPGAGQPRIFGCDLNNNNVAGDIDDGQNIACNYMDFSDVSAYLDWAAIRPMTELEYEKAGRGNNVPVAGEYSWGTTVIVGATAITGGTSGAANETASNVGANCVYNNAAAIQGPMRVGTFAKAATNQEQAGATYFGAMEFTGNLFEATITIGSAAGRSYTGLHGNGQLDAAGSANVSYWPGINGNATITTANNVYGGATGCTSFAGYGFAGGSYDANTWLTLSMREYRCSWATGRDRRLGARGVRTAP